MVIQHSIKDKKFVLLGGYQRFIEEALQDVGEAQERRVLNSINPKGIQHIADNDAKNVDENFEDLLSK